MSSQSSRVNCCRARDAARMPPVEVPQIRSNSSWMRLPAHRSSSRSIFRVDKPFMPPPSMHRMRTPLPSMGGRPTAFPTSSFSPACHVCTSLVSAQCITDHPHVPCLSMCIVEVSVLCVFVPGQLARLQPFAKAVFLSLVHRYCTLKTQTTLLKPQKHSKKRCSHLFPKPFKGFLKTPYSMFLPSMPSNVASCLSRTKSW